jgi:PHD/YefM family antitoxin component YafN of YafNO toxin-antitoxin module
VQSRNELDCWQKQSAFTTSEDRRSWQGFAVVELERPMNSIPVIDPKVKHVGVSKLREMNATKLKETEDTYVIQENEVPLAVLLRYEKFLIMQEQMQSVLNTIDLLQNPEEMKEIVQGLKDFRLGKTRKLSEIEANSKK